MRMNALAVAAGIMLLGGCEVKLPRKVVIRSDFAKGANGWSADISDYPEGSLDTLEFEAGIRALPEEIGDETGFYLKSMNRSDDAFTFIKRKVTAEDGLVAGADYAVEFTIRVASNLPSGCAGVGGAPESAYFKAGAAEIEPEPALDEDAQYVGLTVDKGNQSSGGPAGSLVGGDGNATNGSADCSDDTPYVELEFTHQHQAQVTADEAGNLWLLIGTDSGYEGLTALYFVSIDATLTPAED